MRVILEAGLIPVGSTVTKITGEKRYTLLDELRVFGPRGESQHIMPYDQSRFIVADHIAHSVSQTTELVWHVERDELIEFLRGAEK